MKARLLALFARLAAELTRENARAVDAARGAVACGDIVTYDDSANAMAAVREAIPAERSSPRDRAVQLVRHASRRNGAKRRPECGSGTAALVRAAQSSSSAGREG